MTKLYITILLIWMPLMVLAQRKAVVVNIENGVPVRDVEINTNTNERVKTNWMGEFFLPFKATSFTLTHGKFLAMTIDVDEMPDTIALLPRLTTLGEVIVWGKRPMTFNPKKATEDAKNYYTPSSGVSFDFFSLFQKPKMNSRQRKKHKEIIDTY
jgi:hypothetical protein